MCACLSLSHVVSVRDSDDNLGLSLRRSDRVISLSPCFGYRLPGVLLLHFQTHKRFKRTLFMLIVQELCESRGGRPGLSVLTSLLVSVDVKLVGIGLSRLSLTCQPTSEDIEQHYLPTYLFMRPVLINSILLNLFVCLDLVLE